MSNEREGLKLHELIHEAYFWTGELPLGNPPSKPDFDLVANYLRKALSLLPQAQEEIEPTWCGSCACQHCHEMQEVHDG